MLRTDIILIGHSLDDDDDVCEVSYGYWFHCNKMLVIGNLWLHRISVITSYIYIFLSYLKLYQCFFSLFDFTIILCDNFVGGYSHAPDKLSYGVDMKHIRWCGILQVKHEPYLGLLKFTVYYT